MICPRCGHEMVDGAKFCQFCGRSFGLVPRSAYPPLRAERAPRKTYAGALVIIALLLGAASGTVLCAYAWDRPLVQIIDSEGHIYGSFFVARATVKNTGATTGAVEIICEVRFHDGSKFSDSVVRELRPGDEQIVELLVELPQAYVTDRSLEYRIYAVSL